MQLVCMPSSLSWFSEPCRGHGFHICSDYSSQIPFRVVPRRIPLPGAVTCPPPAFGQLTGEPLHHLRSRIKVTELAWQVPPETMREAEPCGRCFARMVLEAGGVQL